MVETNAKLKQSIRLLFVRWQWHHGSFIYKAHSLPLTDNHFEMQKREKIGIIDNNSNKT